MSGTMTQRREAAARLYIGTLKRLGASEEVIQAAEKVAAHSSYELRRDSDAAPGRTRSRRRTKR
jgi:hypothetical protein